jgi:hypothetical protein
MFSLVTRLFAGMQVNMNGIWLKYGETAMYLLIGSDVNLRK